MFSRSNRSASQERLASLSKIPGLSAGKFYQEWLDGNLNHSFMTTKGYTVGISANRWDTLNITTQFGEAVLWNPAKKYKVKSVDGKWLLLNLEDGEQTQLYGHVYTALANFFMRT